MKPATTPRGGVYVVARSARSNRPVCQHYTTGNRLTLCGYDLTGTSRTYTDQALDAILCTHCRRALGGTQ